MIFLTSLILITSFTIILAWNINRFDYRNRMNIHRYRFKSVIDSIDDENEHQLTISEEISDIIDFYIIKSKEMPISMIDPSVISEYSHILSTGRYFEKVMDDKLASSKYDATEMKILEKVNQFLSGVIKSERRNRSRLKVNYILAGVVSNQLEESINLLSESDEIDESLIIYLNSLIDKEILRLSGPTGTDEDISCFEGVGKVTLSTLQSIRKRLLVEYDMKGKLEIKLLARLLNESDVDKRDEIMLQNLPKIEDLDNFADFVSQGILHIIDSSKSDESDQASSKKQQITVPGRRIDNREKITSESLAKMKDIYASIKQWKKYMETGLRGGDVYSSRSEDYIGKSFKEDQSNDEKLVDKQILDKQTDIYQ